MTKLAAGRDTHLTRAEIAAEALRQFDLGPREPSIRSLAAALKVAPTGIYHHFPSITEIYHAAVELVWIEALTEVFTLVPDLPETDPVDVLVVAGLATRRTWLAHHRVARHLAATSKSNPFTTIALGVMADLLERLGLRGEDAAVAWHSYASFMIGAVLFAAERLSADEQSARDRGADNQHRHYADPIDPSVSNGLSIESVMDLSFDDPALDEALFERGLRRLIEGFR